jgi:importin subunit alpha-6/7
LLKHANLLNSVKAPALRTVGNIITGTDTQTQYVLDLGVLPLLVALLDSPKKNIRKESCWTISNVTGGTKEQIQLVIDCNDAIPKIIQILHSEDLVLQKEAAWVISNATSSGTPDQILYLVQQGSIAALCNLLPAEDPKIITVVLEGLENILKVATQHSGVINEHDIRMFSECGGLKKIKALQSHSNQGIYQRALKILTNYFGGEEV